MMFCTINDCELTYNRKKTPMLVLPGLRHGIALFFKRHTDDKLSEAEEQEEMN
jgi:hypothetical protein